MTKLQRLKARLIAAGLTVDEIQLQNVGPERVPVILENSRRGRCKYVK